MEFFNSVIPCSLYIRITAYLLSIGYHYTKIIEYVTFLVYYTSACMLDCNFALINSSLFIFI